MQEAMHHRREDDAGNDDDDESAVQRIETGKQFSGIGVELIDRTHAAEKHRCVDEGIEPRQTFDESVAGHADEQRNAYERQTPYNAVGETPQELAARGEGLISSLVHKKP